MKGGAGFVHVSLVPSIPWQHHVGFTVPRRLCWRLLSVSATLTHPPGSHINHYLKVTVTLQVTVQLGDICRNYYHSINIFQYSKRKKMMFKRIHFDSDLYITWDRTHHTQQECTVNQNTIKKLQYSQVQFPNLRRCNSFVKVKCVTKQVLQCCWDTLAHESWSPDVIKTCLFGTDSKKTPLSLSK